MTLSKDYSFESERLKFRGIEERDAEIIVAWRSDPANYRFFLDPRPITLEGHLAWFSRYLDDSTRFDFLIEDKAGNAVGTCGLSSIDSGSCEISYMVGATEARGKGYATEAVQALTEVAFRELDVKHVDARILAYNEASMRVAASVGFSEHERLFRKYRDSAAPDQ